MLGLPTKLIVTLGLLGASLAAPEAPAMAGTASALARCVSDNGTDVNAYFGVPRADVIWLNNQGLSPPCVTVIRRIIRPR